MMTWRKIDQATLHSNAGYTVTKEQHETGPHYFGWSPEHKALGNAETAQTAKILCEAHKEKLTVQP